MLDLTEKNGNWLAIAISNVANVLLNILWWISMIIEILYNKHLSIKTYCTFINAVGSFFCQQL